MQMCSVVEIIEIPLRESFAARPLSHYGFTPQKLQLLFKILLPISIVVSRTVPVLVIVFLLTTKRGWASSAA